MPYVFVKTMDRKNTIDFIIFFSSFTAVFIHDDFLKIFVQVKKTQISYFTLKKFSASCNAFCNVFSVVTRSPENFSSLRKELLHQVFLLN